MVSGYKFIYGGQSEPSALILGFSCEEWIEDMFLYLIVYPGTCIRDLEKNVRTLERASVADLFFPGEFCHLCIDGDSPTFFDGIPGIYDQVGHDLIDLGRLHVNEGCFFSWLLGEFDGLAKRPFKDGYHFRDVFVQVEHLWSRRLFSGKAQKLSGQFSGLESGVADFYKMTVETVV